MKVKIVRRKVIRVSDELLLAYDDPQLIRAWCAFCRAPKVGSKKRCEVCGLHGECSTPPEHRSRLYVEIVSSNGKPPSPGSKP